MPTYKEALNVPELVRRIEEAMTPTGRTFDLWIMDDPSRDGVENVVAGLGKPWVRLVTRTPPRGLGYAVVEGLRSASGEILIVMDADLSHPPERLPAMADAAERPDVDFVIGSRYAPGGTIAGDWSLFRHLNSRVATLLARPFTRAHDPMSGFLGMKRALLGKARAELDPIGYKIGLELIVKCGCRKIEEVPIHFSDRTLGKSKMGLAEQIRYVVHVRRLARWKFGELARFVEFGVIGGTGLAVNLIALTLANAGLVKIGMTSQDARLNTAVPFAVFVAMTSNFFLNRVFTFADKRRGHLGREYLSFVGVCLLGGIINWWVTTRLAKQWSDVTLGLQGAAVVGVFAGMFFNYVGSRMFIFRTVRD